MKVREGEKKKDILLASMAYNRSKGEDKLFVTPQDQKDKQEENIQNIKKDRLEKLKEAEKGKKKNVDDLFADMDN